MFDIKEVKAKARAEFNQEKIADATNKIKLKLKELDSAKKIVRNLERELEDLEIAITE